MRDIWNATDKIDATNALEGLRREFRRLHSKARESLLLMGESEADETDEATYSDRRLV